MLPIFNVARLQSALSTSRATQRARVAYCAHIIRYFTISRTVSWNFSRRSRRFPSAALKSDGAYIRQKRRARQDDFNAGVARETKRLSSIDAIAPRGKPSQNMRGNARRPLAIKRFVALKRRGRGGRGVRYFRRRSVRLPLIR